MSALRFKSNEERSGKMNEDIDDVISEKVKIESAKEQLRLEKILTFKFQEMIENKMADVEIKTETKLLSKYEKDFKNLEGQLRKQMKSSEDFQGHSVTKQDFLKLERDFKNLKINVNKDLQKQSEDLKKELKESSKNFIESVFEEKCEDIERKTFSNLKEKCQKYSEEIKKDLSHDVDLKLKDAKEILKNDLKKDFLKQNEELRNTLQVASKAFIEGVVEVKCEEIEKKSFNNLAVKCKKYSEEIKKDLNCDLELKVKGNFENERTILVNEIKSEVNCKGDEIKLKVIHELNDTITKRLQNEKCKLHRSFSEKYELEKLKMECDLKKQISSQVDCDINSLSKRLDVVLSRSLNANWEIEDFKKKLSNDELSIESEVFHLYEFGCKVKFTFYLYPFIGFGVKYVDQPTDEAFPLNGHHRLTFMLHDEVDNKPHHNFIRIFEPTFGDFTDRTFYPYWLTKDELSFLHSRWLKNGKIQVKVIVEHINHVIALEPRYYGYIIWKIDNFKDVCESYQYGRQYSLSEAFYSSEKGYRMKGLLVVDEKVYFRLYFLKGPWDKQLSKEFKHRSMVTLISQMDPHELKDKTISMDSDSSDMDAISGFTKADFEKYVKNDALIISFKVEAL